MISENNINKATEYVISVLLDRLDSDSYSEAIKYIRYSSSDESEENYPIVKIIRSDFFNNYGSISSIPKLPLEVYNDVQILYGSPHWEFVGKSFVSKFDIIASTFFVLTRYEEQIINSENIDDKYRFVGNSSFMVRSDLINHPIVEKYSLLLIEWLEKIGLKLSYKNREFKVTLTHDIDSHRKFYLRKTLRDCLRMRFKRAVTSIPYILSIKKDPYDVFDYLLDLERFIADKVIYFFMVSQNDIGSQGYSINSEKLKNTLNLLSKDTNVTLGLHPGFRAGDSLEILDREKTTLETTIKAKVVDFRFHFLRWKFDFDKNNYSKLGEFHDYSLGYHDHIGFRIGICHPIELFDPIRFERTGIIEHPLLIMDNTLYQYMKLNEQQAVEKCTRIVDLVKEYGGELVLLWHNSEFTGSGYSSSIYLKLLDYIKKL